MRPVSDAFLAALRGSHRMVARARVVAPGQTGVDPDGTEIPIENGDVQLDATADIRSTVDVTTDGHGMWPTSADSLLAPYGNELFVERGIRFGNGTTEWVSLGYHRIHGPEQQDAPNGPIRLSGQDRMAGIVDARLTAPVPFGPADSYGTVVEALIADVFPWATIEWDDTTDGRALGRSVVAEDDRYAFLADLITSVGKTWSWDHRGILVIKDPPSENASVWEVNAGQNGVLVSLSRELSREGVYNAVVATGEAADTVTPVWAMAVDGNPNSPTWWDGPFGKIPRFYSSPFLTTSDQAAIAARSILVKNLGLTYSVNFGSVPNPALEPDDPIRIRYPGRSELHTIKQLTIPLVTTAALTATTREQTTTLIHTS